ASSSVDRDVAAARRVGLDAVQAAELPVEMHRHIAAVADIKGAIHASGPRPTGGAGGVTCVAFLVTEPVELPVPNIIVTTAAVPRAGAAPSGARGRVRTGARTGDDRGKSSGGRCYCQHQADAE